MINFDYVMSRPLSEQEQKEIENSFKIKKSKKKYEISTYSNINSKNKFLQVNDNGFKVNSKK